MKIQISTDFDGCITYQDTTFILIELANSKLTPKLSTKYNESKFKITQKLLSGAKNHELLTSELMKELDEFEMKSARMCSEIKWLKGINRKDLTRKAELIPVRKGSLEYLNTWNPTICSVGWSRDLIAKVLGKQQIYCNDLVFEDGISTGELELLVCCSQQKLKIFQNQNGHIFIGDSITDVQCLLSALVGIVLESRESSTLKSFLMLRDIKLLTVKDAPSKGLYWTKSWSQVHEITQKNVDYYSSNNNN